MKRWITQIYRGFQRKFPTASYYLFQRPKTFLRHSTEKRLVRGARLSKSEHSSILFFTTHKCASRYVSRLLSTLAESKGMVSVDYDSFVTSSRVPIGQHPYKPEGSLSFAFQTEGYCYGPIGSYRRIPELSRYRVVVQLRDPRDILTSLYYSTAFSHSLTSPKLIRQRKEALEISVDEFALEYSKKYLSIYLDYYEKLMSQNDVLFLRYEEMVMDFDGWLAKLSKHTQLDHLHTSLKLIRKQANFQVAKEDIYAQRRQVTPGDHVRKLKPETIEKLDMLFSPILTTLGYIK